MPSYPDCTYSPCCVCSGAFRLPVTSTLSRHSGFSVTMTKAQIHSQNILHVQPKVKLTGSPELHLASDIIVVCCCCCCCFTFINAILLNFGAKSLSKALACSWAAANEELQMGLICTVLCNFITWPLAVGLILACLSPNAGITST